MQCQYTIQEYKHEMKYYKLKFKYFEMGHQQLAQLARKKCPIGLWLLKVREFEPLSRLRSLCKDLKNKKIKYFEDVSMHDKTQCSLIKLIPT